MRKVLEEQLKLGEVDISRIEFDPKSRDGIPQLLKGLQYIYINPPLRDQVFDILKKGIKTPSKGRRGMDLWRILVFGVLRLNCNWDYDTLKEMADNHGKLREMLGHVPFFDKTQYPIQTLKDNVHLLTPALLDNINAVVVGAGHNLVKKKEKALSARADSFVLETNVHYPTDFNLLWDACRKATGLTAELSHSLGLPGWRQMPYQLRQLKKRLTRCAKIKLSPSSNSKICLKNEQRQKLACESCLDKSRELAAKARVTLALIADQNPAIIILKDEIKRFLSYADHQVALIERRILKGERIPHREKIFSVFEPHTEWISKGKAGVPQELGLKVCIMEDQYGFLLGHHVMKKQSDVEVAVPFVEAVKNIFPDLKGCSFDKGFWSPGNQEKLEKILDILVLPKKGKLSRKDKERETSPKFGRGRKQHSAVESAINALENHGLDRCPDRGERGFRRYVSMAILGRNLQKLGAILQAKEREYEKRSRSIKAALARKCVVQAA